VEDARPAGRQTRSPVLSALDLPTGSRRRHMQRPMELSRPFTSRTLPQRDVATQPFRRSSAEMQPNGNAGSVRVGAGSRDPGTSWPRPLARSPGQCAVPVRAGPRARRARAREARVMTIRSPGRARFASIREAGRTCAAFLREERAIK